MRWKTIGGSASSRLLALILVGTLILGFGLTAFAMGDENQPDLDDSELIEIVDLPNDEVEEISINTDTEAEQPESELKNVSTPELDVERNTDESAISPEQEPTEPSEQSIEAPPAGNDEDVYESVVSPDNPFDEATEPTLPPDTDHHVEEDPIFLDDGVKIDEEQAKATSLEDILISVSDEFIMLSSEEKKQIYAIWRDNDFAFSDPSEMLYMFTDIDGLSEEAVFLLYLYNAEACVKYVADNHSGGTLYLEMFVNAFNSVVDGYIDLHNGDASLDVWVDVLTRGYQNMMQAGIAEAQETGLFSISDLVAEYGKLQGEQDAEQFFLLVNNI